MPLLDELKDRAHQLRAETWALALATRHPATPWHARLLVALIVAYALSPIDLIPDFIPVLGYLDEIILLPFGIVCAIRLIPPEIMADCRAKVRASQQDSKPRSMVGAALIILIWLALAVLGLKWAGNLLETSRS